MAIGGPGVESAGLDRRGEALLRAADVHLGARGDRLAEGSRGRRADDAVGKQAVGALEGADRGAVPSPNEPSAELV